MRFAILAVSCLALVVGTLGHAALTKPTAWNRQPSKRAPCGGGAPTAPQALVAGQPWAFEWRVIAGDGTGPVEIKMAAPTATPTFAGAVLHSTASTNDLMPRVATFPFTVPATATTKFTGCEPPAGCVLQFRSTSNWYACANVAISTGGATVPTDSNPTTKPGGTTRPPRPTPRPTPQPTPNPTQVAQGLEMCSGINGKSIGIAADRNIVEMEQALLGDRNQALANYQVWKASSTEGCVAAYTQELCALSFPPQGKQEGDPGTVCKSLCEQVNKLCDLHDDHKELYDCNLPQFSSTTADSTGNCPAPGATPLASYAYQPPARAQLTPSPNAVPSDGPTTGPATKPVAPTPGVNLAGGLSGATNLQIGFAAIGAVVAAALSL